jgi:Leucine-rich repeat (LRR) protein
LNLLAPERLLRIGSAAVGVRELTLQNTANFAPVISHCANLRTLVLALTSISSDDLELITQFGTLTKLQMSNCHIIAARGEFDKVSRLTGLRQLNLSAMYSWPLSTSALSSMSALRSLDLSHSPWLSDRYLEALRGMSELESLNLSSCSAVGDTSLEHIAHLTQMKSLTLDYCRITNSGLRHLANLDRLESLSLRATDITTMSLHILVKFVSLKELDVRDCLVWEISLSWLPSSVRVKQSFQNVWRPSERSNLR